MKRTLIFLIVAAICFTGMLTACEQVPDESAIQTTSAEPSTDPQTTTAETTTETTTSHSMIITHSEVIPRQTTAEKPGGNVYQPTTPYHSGKLYWYAPTDEWYYSPAYETKPSENYDFVFTLKDAHQEANAPLPCFHIMPSLIVCEIKNQTGEGFSRVGSAYLEYLTVAPSGQQAWVRVPYVNTDENREGVHTYPQATAEYIVKMNESRYLGDNLLSFSVYPSGNYRLVFFLDDGPHYVEFICLSAPE